MNSGRPKGYALILAPTRELALQIADAALHIMSNFVEEDGNKHNPLEIFRLVGGENAADQALALAWCRHHFIAGKKSS